MHHLYLALKINTLMYIIILLITISLLVAIGFLISFFWAIKDGQYEDDYTPAIRILLDDQKSTEHDDH